MIEQPRMPVPATTHLVGEERNIQVYLCRMPDCENYGKPAQSKYSKLGPSAGRGPHQSHNQSESPSGGIALT